MEDVSEPEESRINAEAFIPGLLLITCQVMAYGALISLYFWISQWPGAGIMSHYSNSYNV